VLLTNQLLLQRPDHDPMHEILLQERVQHQDRQGRDDDRRVFDRDPDIHPVARRGARHHVIGAVGDQNLAQHELKREQLAVPQINQRIEIGVPMPDGVPQDHDRDDRHGEGNDDSHHNGPVVRAVDPRRFLQAHRNALESGTHNDEVERIDRARQQQRPGRIQHAQIVDEQERRNQAAAEDHRNDDHEHNMIFKIDMRAREGIGTQRGHE